MKLAEKNGVRVAHVGDLHLGRRWLNAQTPNGVNLREGDVYAMADAIAEFLCLNDVDICVIAGDLYDSTNPSTRARGAGFRFVNDLARAGIDVVVLAGNHDHAHSSHLSPLVHLAEFFGVHLALRQTHFDVRGVRFHMLPHQSLANLSAGGQLEPFDFHGTRDVLVSHAYLTHPDLGAAPEPVQLPLAVADDPAFCVVMLGHIHQHVRLGERVHYSGAVERLNTGEIDAPLGLWVHDIGSDGTVVTHDVPLDALGVPGLPRAMFIIAEAQTDRGLDDLNARMLNRAGAQDLTGAIVQLRILDADPDLRQSAYPLLWKERVLDRGALYCDVQMRSRPLEEALNERMAPLPTRLDDGYRNYLVGHGRGDLVDLALTTLEGVEKR